MNSQISELTVSEKTIMHQWRESAGTLHLLLRSDLPANKAAACLREARAGLSLPRRWGTDLGGLATTPKGPVLILHGLTERREVVDVVRQVAENLRKQGVTGRLMSWGFQASPVDNPLLTLHSVAAGISLRGSESYDPPVPGVPRARIEYHWDVDPEMLAAVIDYALQWCRLPAGTYFVSSGLSQFKCTEEARRELLVAAYGGVRRRSSSRRILTDPLLKGGSLPRSRASRILAGRGCHTSGTSDDGFASTATKVRTCYRISGKPVSSARSRTC